MSEVPASGNSSQPEDVREGEALGDSVKFAAFNFEKNSDFSFESDLTVDCMQSLTQATKCAQPTGLGVAGGL